MNTPTTASVRPTAPAILRLIAEANLANARERYATVETQLVWATTANRPEGQLEQIEERLDGVRAEMHTCELELEELSRRDRSEADQRYVEAHPDRVFGEVMEANGDAHVLASSRRRLEREWRRCTRLGYPTEGLEAEIRVVRAALHVVTRSPDWLEAARQEREDVAEWEASVDAIDLEQRRKWASQWRREGGGVRVGLMSLAVDLDDHSEVA